MKYVDANGNAYKLAQASDTDNPIKSLPGGYWICKGDPEPYVIYAPNLMTGDAVNHLIGHELLGNL